MKPQKSEGVKRLIAEIPASTFVRFKIECTQQGLSVKEAILSFIESWLSGDSEIEIQPAKRNPEQSLEGIVERVIEKKFAGKRIEIETAAEPIDVHNVEEQIPEEIEEEIPEKNEEPVGAEEPEDSKPKKKKWRGLWPWVREVEIEEEKEESGKP